MKSAQTVFDSYTNTDGFLTAIVKNLEKNNNNLADMIAKEMESKKEANARERVFEMMLLASEIMGLTDPEDPDFIEILPDKKIKKNKSTITEIPTRYFTELLPVVYQLNEDINNKEASENLPKVPFPDIWNKILKIAIAVSVSRKP